ncbi:MAG TPA: aldo/keto reductase [Kofleriaceae bacterium]|nr:aldo/keto reductase [Kofleriaceae bacterium]
MRYKKLGRTGLIVSEACLGTMTFGGDGFWRAIGAQPQAEATALVKAAFDAGVNFFDTANVYSNGQSETMLGQAVRDLGLPRDEIVVATKVFGRVMDVPAPDASDAAKAASTRRNGARNVSGLSRKHIFDSVDASLQRLGCDYIDLYQVHGTDPITPIEETVAALDDVVRSGKVRYLGLCNMPAWLIMKAIGIAERRNMHRFESCQMYYTIAGRDLERDVVPLANDQQLAILPWSPLAGGFLSGKYKRPGAGHDAGPAGARRVAFDFPPINKERAYDIIDVMEGVAAERNATVAQIALAWLFHQPHVTSVILGARTAEQLAANLAATNVKLTADDLQKLNTVSALPSEYPGWMLERQGGDRRAQLD